MSEMAEELVGHVRAGRINGLGIVFVTADDRTHMGYGATDGSYFRLAGAIQMLGHTVIADRVRYQEEGKARGEAAA
jgi:hypothetical protein